MTMKLLAIGLLAGTCLPSGAAAWERDAYGCAAEALPCPARLSADEVRLILGFGNREEAAAYYDASFNAGSPERVTVNLGTYRPIASEYQSVYPPTCLIASREARALGPDMTMTAQDGSLTWGQTPAFPYAVSENELLVVLGLCGAANPNGDRSLSDWVGPGARLWAKLPPDSAVDSMDYLVVGPNGRMAHAMAVDHGIFPPSAGGNVESWHVTHYELLPGSGTVVEIGLDQAGTGTPPPARPEPLSPAAIADRLWVGADPCSAMRKLEAALVLGGKGDVLAMRTGDSEGPQACADRYRALSRQLRGDPAPAPADSVPVFLWTLP